MMQIESSKILTSDIKKVLFKKGTMMNERSFINATKYWTRGKSGESMWLVVV